MPASVEQQLPDLNYVLDYNPEDESGTWVGEYRREPESPYWNDYQSPVGTWKEAQAALLEYHAERSMQQGPEGPVGLRWVNRYIRSRLEGATPNQEFYLDSDDPEVVKAFIETYQTSQRPYFAFWRIRQVPGDWGKLGKTAEVVAPDQVMPDLDNVLDYEPQESWEGIWHSYSPRYQTPEHQVNWHTSGLWDDCREGLENLLESIWNTTQYAPEITEQLKMAEPGQPFAWNNPYNKEDDWVKIEIRQMRTAKVAVELAEPTTQQMPDLNYVLDYNPEDVDDTEVEWFSCYHSTTDMRGIPGTSKDFIRHVTWEEARNFLLFEGPAEMIPHTTRGAFSSIPDSQIGRIYNAEPNKPFYDTEPCRGSEGAEGRGIEAVIDTMDKFQSIYDGHEARLAGPGHVPLAPYDPVKGGYPVMPDTNYVLDYNPEDEIKEGWKASIWGPVNDMVWKLDPKGESQKKMEDHCFSPSPISWQEAWEFLNDRWNRQLVPEVGPALQNATPDQEFVFRVKGDWDSSTFGIEEPYSEWRIEKALGGGTISHVAGLEPFRDSDEFFDVEPADPNVELGGQVAWDYAKQHWPDLEWTECPKCGAPDSVSSTNLGPHCWNPDCGWWANGGKNARVSNKAGVACPRCDHELRYDPVEVSGWLHDQGYSPEEIEELDYANSLPLPDPETPEGEKILYCDWCDWPNEQEPPLGKCSLCGKDAYNRMGDELLCGDCYLGHMTDPQTWGHEAKLSMAMTPEMFQSMLEKTPVLYHVTEPNRVGWIQGHGIVPGSEVAGATENVHQPMGGIPAREGAVYLWTDERHALDGAVWFLGIQSSDPAIFHIDASKLDPNKIEADEDYISSDPTMFNEIHGGPTPDDYYGDTEGTDWSGYDPWEIAAEPGNDWAKTHPMLGDPEVTWGSYDEHKTVAYVGVVPPEAIIKVELMSEMMDRGVDQGNARERGFFGEPYNRESKLADAQPEYEAELIPDFGYGWKILRVVWGKAVEGGGEGRTYDLSMNEGDTNPSDYVLVSPAQSTVWPVEGLQADPAPIWDDYAGIYVVDDPGPVLANYDSKQYQFYGDEVGVALVKCQIWGRCVRHKAGYRAEYAKPYEIRLRESPALNDENGVRVPTDIQKVAQALRAEYKCDVIVDDYRKEIKPNEILRAELERDFPDWIIRTVTSSNADTVIYPSDDSHSKRAGVTQYITYIGGAGNHIQIVEHRHDWDNRGIERSQNLGQFSTMENAAQQIKARDQYWGTYLREVDRQTEQMIESDDLGWDYDGRAYAKLAEFDQWQGAGNWDTWTVNGAIEGNWGSEIYYALQKFMQQAPTFEQFEQYVIENIIGPFNKERESEAHEYNTIPRHDRLDYSFEAYKDKKDPDRQQDWSELDQYADIDDIDLNTTQINPWNVNFELLYEWAQRDFGVKTSAVNPVNYEHHDLTPHEMGLFDALEPRERKLWRDRAENLNRRARATGDPGRVNGRALFAIAQRFNNQCAYCDKDLNWGGGGNAEVGRNHPQMANDPAAGTFDHNHPLKEGGSGGIENIVPACWRCNQDINDWDKSLKPEEYAPSGKSYVNPLIDADPFNPFEI